MRRSSSTGPESSGMAPPDRPAGMIPDRGLGAPAGPGSEFGEIFAGRGEWTSEVSAERSERSQAWSLGE
jgi:hypothetical protein